MDPATIGLLVGIVTSAIENIPKLVAAIQNSIHLSEEQKAAYIEQLSLRLDATVERVKAVKFLDTTDPANLPPR